MVAHVPESFVNESRLYMWRAIVAVAHADGIVTIEETDFISKCFEMNSFSAGQREILMRDLGQPQDILTMFSMISEEKDKIDFFIHAEALSSVDGKFCGKERKSINGLKKDSLLGFPVKLLKEKIAAQKALSD